MFHVKQDATQLRAENLIVGYGRRDVVDIHELAFLPGTVTSLIGPNAAGKSTLVRALAGALKPRSGSVTINGQDIHRMSASSRARRLAFVSQQSEEQFAFTVRELVTLGARANAAASRPTGERITAALDQLDLAPIADRDLLGLSGGERQRAGLARALAQETDVLILDEPTAHLDLRHQSALLTAVRAAASDHGVAVILVLHDLNLAGAFSNRLILLANGRIVADAEPSEVLTLDTIESAYQTKVQQLKAATGVNPYIHLDTKSGKSIDPLV